jgi:hypothetical protein
MNILQQLKENFDKVVENVPKVYEAGVQRGMAMGGGDSAYELGYQEGYAAGNIDGSTAGQETGRVIGKQEAIDAWVNNFTQNGKRTNY